MAYRDQPGQRKKLKRIYEDDPRWDPKTMGNKRGSLKPRKPQYKPKYGGTRPWATGERST